jgi:outer membrane receptor for ferrienterochelin and colicin
MICAKANSGSGRRIRTSLVLVASTVVAFAGAIASNADAQSSDRYEGRPVGEVLRQLQSRGAPIIFSSALVSPELRVKAEPRKGRGMRALAEEILAPHGLTFKDGPGKTWVVVRAQTATPRALEERVTESPPVPAEPRDREGQSQTPMRIEEEVYVNERAGDLAGAPNTYAVDPTKVIETAGSLENVFQLLPGLPGIAATNDRDGKLAVRGAGPEHNTVVIDGVQVHSPQRLASDLGGQQSFVNPATVANLALDASGLDARYGGRLSSVTLFETRDGATSRRLAVSGSAGLTSGDILAEGRLPGTDTGSWWATTRGTYYRLVADRFKDGDIPSFVDFQFKVAARPTARTRLSVLGLIGAEAMVRPLLSPADQRQGYAGENLTEFHADSRLAVTNLQWTPGPRVTTTTTISAYSSASREQDGWIDWQTGQPFDRRVQVVDVAARQRASIAWSPRHVLDIGGEVHRVRGSWAMTGVNLLPRRSVGPDVWGKFVQYERPIDARLVRTQVGAWAQDRVPLAAGFAVEPGLRLDWNSFTGETAVQPRLRLTKTINTGVVWAGVAWQAQTPGYETMQQGLAYYDLAGAGASDLRNERSRQIVAGFDRRLAAGMVLRVEAYHRAFDRLMVQRQETELERQQRLSRYEIPPDMPSDSALLEYRPTSDPESTGTGRATGVEILLDRSRGRVSGWVSYTLSKADRELFGHTVPFDFDRRHALGVALNVGVTPRLRVSLRSQYASGFPLTPLHDEVDFDDDRNVRPGPPPGSKFQSRRSGAGALLMASNLDDPPRLSLLNSARMSGYGRTDVRVSYAIDSHFDVYGEVINLFDRANFNGRSAGVGAVDGEPISYQVARAFPRLFTYGVRFRF